MKLLDLFCGAGGASTGYHVAGFKTIVGIDIKPQPRYPYDFIQADALNPPVKLEAFDLIHASPPCQRFTQARSFNKIRYDINWRDFPDLLTPCREMLSKTNIPFILENVPGAPMRTDIVLCGTMFGLRVFRHRWFEINDRRLGGKKAKGLNGQKFEEESISNDGGKTARRQEGKTANEEDGISNPTILPSDRFASSTILPPGRFASSAVLPSDRFASSTVLPSNHQAVFFLTPPCQHEGTVKDGDYYCVVGNGGMGMTTTPYARKAQCAEAMGIDWMTRKELTQAIPPAYTTFIGKELIKLWQGK